jgi:ATP-dependent metalloprotease FtsH
MDLLRKLWNKLRRPRVYVPIALGVATGVLFRYVRSIPVEVKLSAFIAALNASRVSEVIDYGDRLHFRTPGEPWARINVEMLDKSQIMSKTLEQGGDYSIRSSGRLNWAIVAQLGSVAAMLAIVVWQNSRDKPTKRILEHKTDVTFANIAGNHEAKQSLQEIINFLKFPDRFRDVGASLPKGVLLYGPSGTGKTMLAKATAGEAGVNFIQASGSEFIEMFVGVGARRVRDLFEQARKEAPCIVFIDEIDSLALRRGFVSDRSSVEHHSTINQLLTEMDGFNPSQNIVVLAATNKPDLIDDAILRPGRFDRKIVVTLPDEATRLHILELSLTPRKNSVSEELLRHIASTGHELTGADLACIVNEASFTSIRANHNCIEEADLQEAFTHFMESKMNFKVGCVAGALSQQLRR